MKNLSIIIPCSDDDSLKKCLDSIDIDVETIVIFNGSKKSFIKRFQNMKIISLVIEEKSIPKACNLGVSQASGDYIFLMNSDCIFQKGALQNLLTEINSAPLYHCKVIFSGKGHRKLASLYRHYHYEVLKKFYQPGIIFKRTLLIRLGYLFDERFKWTEDADLARRLNQLNLSVVQLKESVIIHEENSLRRDLKSAYRYGQGRRKAEMSGAIESINPPSLLKSRSGHRFFEIAISIGFWPALYARWAWRIAYIIGYYGAIYLD